MGMHLVGVYLTGLRLTGMHLMSVHLMGMHLIGVHLKGVHVIGVHFICVHLTGCVPHEHTYHLRVFLARRTRVARILISTPRMVEKLLIVGDSAVRLLVTLGARSAW